MFTVHCRSAHPQQVKRAVVKNQVEIAVEVIRVGAERNKSIALAKQLDVFDVYKAWDAILDRTIAATK